MTKSSYKNRRGRPSRHMGYSLIVRAGQLPQRRAYLRAYLTEIREGLVKDFGPAEEDLTTAQRVTIDRVISKLGVIRCIEEHVGEDGVFRGRELASVLAKSYITYCESLERSLRALGLTTHKAREILDPLAIAAEIDARKDTDPGEIVDPGASQSETQGENHDGNEDQAGSGENPSADAVCDQAGGGGIRDDRAAGEAAAESAD